VQSRRSQVVVGPFPPPLSNVQTPSGVAPALQQRRERGIARGIPMRIELGCVRRKTWFEWTSVAALALAAALAPPPVRADAVSDWNASGDDVTFAARRGRLRA
jgi:hypothetical protein